MKLGMFIPEFPTQTHAFFWREIEALRSLGVDVQILSTRRPSDDCPHDFARRAIQQTHYVYPPSVAAAAWSVSRPAGLARSLRYIGSLSESIRGKIRALGYLLCAVDLARFARSHQLDHIHVHSCADAAHIVAMARLMGGAPYSLHLHGDLPVYGKDHAQKMAHAAFVSAAAKPMQRQVIEQVGIPEARTHTMWMGVDTTRAESRPAGPVRTSPLHLVSVGRLHLCKGHRYTLQALRKVLDRGADIRYTIAGSGPHQAEIAASVKDGKFGDRVRMVGSLGEAEVLALLRSADAFVLSSTGLGEASPVAVMEAMAAGVPAVCSIIGGTPEMIADGIDGLLVAQEDVAGLTSAIQRLHDDRPFRLQLGAAARSRAVTQFDSRVTAQKLLSAIEQSMGVQ